MADKPIREQSARELLETHAKALEADNARLREELLVQKGCRYAAEKMGQQDIEKIGRLRAALIEVSECISHQDFMRVRRVVSAALRSAVETDGDDARDAARYRWIREHYLSYEFTGPHGPTRLTRNVDPDLDGWMDAYRLDKPYSPVETAAKPPLDTDDIERLAREHFCEVHGIPPVDQWPMMPEEVKESYRQWIRNKQSELAAEKAK